MFFLGAYASEHESLIVMEYVQRGSLDEHLHDPALSISQAMRVRFMRDAASGMAYLHNLSPPRIHRDLKSMNLLVTDNWVVKVADFTTAKKMLKGRSAQVPTRMAMPPASASVLVEDTTTYGTLHWSAPEVLAGKPYTLAVDAYSFGIVMWEVLTREIPFSNIRFFGALREAVVDKMLRPPLPQRFTDALDRFPNAGTRLLDGLDAADDDGDDGGVLVLEQTTVRSTSTDGDASKAGSSDDGDRGEVEVDEVDAAYVRLLQRCWRHDPHQRPAFVQIELQLQRMLDRIGADGLDGGSGDTGDGVKGSVVGHQQLHSAVSQHRL